MGRVRDDPRMNRVTVRIGATKVAITRAERDALIGRVLPVTDVSDVIEAFHVAGPWRPVDLTRYQVQRVLLMLKDLEAEKRPLPPGLVALREAAERAFYLGQ